MTETPHTDDGDGENGSNPAQAVADMDIDLRSEDASEPDAEGGVTGDVSHSEEPPTEAIGEVPEEDEFEEKFGVSEEELRGEAEQEARRQLSNAEGETKADRLDTAIRAVQQRHQGLRSQLEQAHQRKSQAESNQEDLSFSADRLREIEDDEDRLVIRTLRGGIAEEVQTDERADLAEQLDEKVDDLTETIDSIEEKEGAILRGLKKCEFAHDELQDAQGLLSDSAGDLLG